MRARRFSIQVPLEYRFCGESAWREGHTENISRSGVLFWSESVIEIGARVELKLMLPVEIRRDDSGAVIKCQAQIVRNVQAQTPVAKPTLAAKILDYQFAPGRCGSQIKDSNA